MQISGKEEKGIHIFSLDGRFDAHSAGDVEKELNLTISKGVRKLLLDMDSVEYISGAGLRGSSGIGEKTKKGRGRDKDLLS